MCKTTISLKQIRLLHRCFENHKASVSQDKTIFEWQQQHSAATPANWKLFNFITDTEGRNSSTLWQYSKVFLFYSFFERKSTTIYRLQGGKNTDRFRKPKWIWLLETLRILENWMNLLNSMDLLISFIPFSNNHFVGLCYIIRFALIHDSLATFIEVFHKPDISNWASLSTPSSMVFHDHLCSIH